MSQYDNYESNSKIETYSNNKIEANKSEILFNIYNIEKSEICISCKKKEYLLYLDMYCSKCFKNYLFRNEDVSDDRAKIEYD